MKVVVRKKESIVPVTIATEFIKLESAMKLANILPTGGAAKQEIQEGFVQVNGEVCTMRGKKLYPGDTFAFMGGNYKICEYEANNSGCDIIYIHCHIWWKFIWNIRRIDWIYNIWNFKFVQNYWRFNILCNCYGNNRSIWRNNSF